MPSVVDGIMTGDYLRMQISGRCIGPVIAFREYVFRDVLPAFGNLGDRAEQAAEEYYSLIGSQHAGEYGDIDMGDVADGARDHALGWYQMMTSLRQTMLNLLTAGLFHLTEQQLAALCRDAGFRVDPPRDTKLDEVEKWYKQHLKLDLKTLPSWTAIDELRLVANAVKHAEGAASKQLKRLRPELFINPDYAKFYKEQGLDPYIGSVAAPLAGEDLFVSEVLLRRYAGAAESFFGEISGYFSAHGGDFF